MTSTHWHMHSVRKTGSGSVASAASRDASSTVYPSDGFDSAHPSRSVVARPGAAEYSIKHRESPPEAVRSVSSALIPSGSPSARCAFFRRLISTTDASSPALDRHQVCALGRAIMVLVTAPHESQFVCSRSSSRTIRSADRPRPALRLLALTLYRSPV